MLKYSGFQKLGVPFSESHTMDYSFGGSILASPDLISFLGKSTTGA